jgi:hypothetical protein
MRMGVRKFISLLNNNSLSATNKLVNLVKPMPGTETNDFLEGSALQETIACYLNHNGMTGKKVADHLLRDNLQKINKMIDRSTKKFFTKHQEPVMKENIYDADAEFGPSKSERQKMKQTEKKSKVTLKEIPHHDYLAPKFTAEPLKRLNFSYRRQPLANQSNLIDSGTVEKIVGRRGRKKKDTNNSGKIFS